MKNILRERERERGRGQRKRKIVCEKRSEEE